jgi:hypothetical protein
VEAAIFSVQESHKLGGVHAGNRIGDGLPLPFAGREALLDLDAAYSAGGQPVHDVARAAAAEVIARLRDTHRDPRAGQRSFDGQLDLPLQGLGRAPAYQDIRSAVPVEGDGIPEAREMTRPSFGKLAG